MYVYFRVFRYVCVRTCMYTYSAHVCSGSFLYVNPGRDNESNPGRDDESNPGRDDEFIRAGTMSLNRVKTERDGAGQQNTYIHTCIRAYTRHVTKIITSTHVTEIQYATDKTEIQYATDKTEIQYATDKTEIQYATDKTEIQYATDKTEIQYATDKTETTQHTHTHTHSTNVKKNNTVWLSIGTISNPGRAAHAQRDGSDVVDVLYDRVLVGPLTIINGVVFAVTGTPSSLNSRYAACCATNFDQSPEKVARPLITGRAGVYLEFSAS
jgi:hypothetical protein